MLPNFFIVGAPKAGTTSLYHYLAGHPEVFMSSPKELNYYSREDILAQDLFYDSFTVASADEYEQLFREAQGIQAVGEASVSYFYYPGTPARIKRDVPAAKIVILLRNPVERGFSHYLMDYKLGYVDLPYEDIVNKAVEHKYLDLYYQQYVELGLYYVPIRRYIDMFGVENVKIYLQDELKEDASRVVLDLYDFLQIDKSYVPDTGVEHNAFAMPKNRLVHYFYSLSALRSSISRLLPKGLKEYLMSLLFERNKKPGLGGELKSTLMDIYEPDIKKLETLISRDLASWYKRD